VALEGMVGGEVAGICFSDSTRWVALLDNISAGVFRRQTYANKERESFSCWKCRVFNSESCLEL